MPNVRPAAVAGTFYTEDRDALKHQVLSFLEQAPAGEMAPKALIVPHAGYIYSGPVAATAYNALRGHAERIARVVLLGPAHRVYVEGVGASSADQFATPLGMVRIDQDAVRALVDKLDFVRYADDAHQSEHSLEVQLPFLQLVLADFSLLPLVVGRAEPHQIDELLEQVWGEPDTLLLISSDLSHYHDYQTARRLDLQTTGWIEQGDIRNIGSDNACGQIPIRGLLLAARRHGLRCQTLDLRNSGDTAGPTDRVVGYGAYAFFPAGGSA